MQHSLAVSETQDESCEEVARLAAVFAARTIGGPCIKLDVGFYITSLSGFPGPFVKFINDWLSEEDILAMVDWKEERSAYFLDATAIGYPDGLSKVFSTRHTGTIAKSGGCEASNWTANSLFIPTGYEAPLGSLGDVEQEAYWGGGAWKEVIAYLEQNI